MPFIPHTDSDVKTMLATIGVTSIEALFDEIPADLRQTDMDGVPEGLNEHAVGRLMRARANLDGTPLNFAGAGAYEHHVPAAIWDITTRGEFYSAYTPYQAEASQGTLQLIYEYQTMMARLMEMEVSNASLYDGASGLAEAVLMAVRANRTNQSQRILVPESVHPAYRKVLATMLPSQDLEMVEVPFDTERGATDLNALDEFGKDGATAVVVPQPNYFGILEDIDAITDFTHSLNALAVAVVNPMSLGLLKAPGSWGARGADIACGEGQPLGIPLSSGGPYFGFLTCKQTYVRQMPGRLVGRTVDVDGREGYTLTLQAREQHIRRAKATSNICTNQGLMVTAATQYLAMMGAEGLKRVALASHQNTRALVEQLTSLDDVNHLFDSPYFHECALELPIPASQLIDRLAERNIVAGVSLSDDYEQFPNALLVCATETKTDGDLAHFVSGVESILKE